MRAIVLAVGLVALAGCSSAVDEAEADLAMIKNAHGSKEEICAAKKKVAEAYLKTRDELKYESKKLDANVACMAGISAYDPNATQPEKTEVGADTPPLN